MGEDSSIVYCGTCGAAMIVSAAASSDASANTEWVCDQCEERADQFSQWGKATTGTWGIGRWFVPTWRKKVRQRRRHGAG